MRFACKDNTLGIILAHGKAAETVVRHIPVWELNCGRIFFFTPVDDVLPLPVQQYAVGKSAAYSTHTNRRCREALRFASLTDYPHVMLAEYDSLIFKALSENPKGPDANFPGDYDLIAPQFHDPENRRFRGKFYLHFPMLVTRAGVHRLVEAMDRIPIEAEDGFTDRYVGLAAQEAGLYIKNLHNSCPEAVYTQNHIDREKLPEAIAAYRKGAFWSHGIKDQHTFDQLQANVQP